MRKRQMPRLGCMLSAVVLTAIAQPVAAAEWIVIGAEPDPAPHRSVYVTPTGDAWIFERFADGYDPRSADSSRNALAIDEANTLRTTKVVQVFENKGNTDFIVYYLHFNCQKGLVRIAEAISFTRSDTVEDRRESSEFMRVPDNWLGKAEIIACGWKNWREAETEWLNRNTPAPRGNKGKAPQASLASLGIRYLGDYFIAAPTEVVAGVWKELWTDAVQPPYTISRTPEERAALHAKTDAMYGEMKTLLSDAQELSKVRISLSDKADRLGGDAAREMGSIGGQTEQQVVARWGAPASVIESDGVRTLTYHYGKEQYGVGNVQVDIVGPGGKVGETYQPTLTTSSRQCSRTLHLRQMGAPEKAWRVFDFDIGC
jgi:hypothetical protein